MSTFKTYNDVTIPGFMYGTAWKKEATKNLVELAVASGFTAIDTANQLIHYDEALVGAALQSLAQQGVSREQLFLQTKFTPVNGQDHRTPYDANATITMQVQQSVESSLQHLHTDILDSYVLHGPYGRMGLSKEDWEVWSALEDVYQTKKARMIGISNVSAIQLAELCEKAKVKPMVVQNRCYAVMGWDKEVREICQAHQIIYQGFSLLTANQQILRAPELWAIAKRLGAGPLQVIFRFAQQLGMLPLTGTTDEAHMKEDLQSDSFDLTQEEVKKIELLGV